MSAPTTALLLAGDVMTGRGIDQILGNPSDPVLYEGWIQDARDYVRLAEERNGLIPRGVDDRWIWGDAIELFTAADATSVINLETAVTDWPEPWPNKGINYRMHPRNVGCLSAAHIDCCVLANNHTLDWCAEGLAQTLEVLGEHGIPVVGAGPDAAAAMRPAVLETSGPRVCVLGLGSPTSGIPARWAAQRRSPGVAFARSLSQAVVGNVAETIALYTKRNDLVIVSIHWGPNWGYEIDDARRRFARALVEDAGADVVHGHSSHHPLGIEVHRGRPIVYGCGDLINDYEGISGHDEVRPDLGLAYRLDISEGADPVGGIRLVPFRRRRFRLEHASTDDRSWLRTTLDRECRRLGSHVALGADGAMTVEW